MQHILLLISSGFVASFLSGILGISGGIILMPLLLIILANNDYNSQLSVMHLAINTSLALTAINSLINVWQQSKHMTVDRSLLKNILPMTLMGIVIGSYLSQKIQPQHVGIIAGCLFFIIAIISIFNIFNTRIGWKNDSKSLALKITGTFIGTSASFLGIGGGSIMVPVYNFYGLELKKIVGISAMFTLISSLSSLFLILFFSLLNTKSLSKTLVIVDWYAVILLLPIFFIGVKLGAFLLHRIPKWLIKTLLVTMLISLSFILILLDQI